MNIDDGYSVSDVDVVIYDRNYCVLQQYHRIYGDGDVQLP